jgi:hypothetical protein
MVRLLFCYSILGEGAQGAARAPSAETENSARGVASVPVAQTVTAAKAGQDRGGAIFAGAVVVGGRNPQDNGRE